MLDIDDEVMVLPFDTQGRIIAIYISAAEPMYKVRYFLESEVREEYFYNCELNGPHPKD